MTLVYTPRSVGIARALLLLVWFASVAELSAIVALLVRIHRTGAGPGAGAGTGDGLSQPLGAVLGELATAFPDHANEFRLAYTYIDSDPKSSLTKSRMIAEAMLTELFNTEMGR